MAAKIPRREGMQAVGKICNSIIDHGQSNQIKQLSTRTGGDGARRHQSVIDELQVDDSETTKLRGGPKRLQNLTLKVISSDKHYIVINKDADTRLDGNFDATIEHALHRDFPHIEKFRWIHQLDFATSGVMCIGVDKEATSFACRLFREKRVQKEYLAVVRGHLPFNPHDATIAPGRTFRTCTFSKMGLLMQDTEDFERWKTERKGTAEHLKHPLYPRGVRQAPSFFYSEYRELKRIHDTNERLLTHQEKQVLSFVKWTKMPREEQQKYISMMHEDKKRHLTELVAFLDIERKRIESIRCYDVSECKETEEPIAYVFNDPIAEPDKDSFRMRIGDPTNLYDPSIGGKASTTIAFVLGHDIYQNEPVTKVLLRPLTGRRHQLRLHLAHFGFPIIGDATYASDNETAPRMMLHAWRLWFMTNSPTEMNKYGDLYFESEDPFGEIVPTSSKQMSLTTMTRDKK